jgi:selenobiotic family peptide radical SAM maturase
MVGDVPPCAADLARLELAMEEARLAPAPEPASKDTGPAIRPGATLLPVAWQGLPNLALGTHGPDPEPGEELVLVWPAPGQASGAEVRVEAADNDALLALKIVAEGLSLPEAAREAGVPPGALWDLLRAARDKGLLVGDPGPPDRHLARDPAVFPRPGQADEAPFPPQIFAAEAFTLQWHITQACDMRCRHCYDRSPRGNVSRQAGLEVIGEMEAFCRSRGVRGQVTFTGGNPLLHPHFMEFYAAAAEAGLAVAILGNPCPAETLDALLGVAQPAYYQISLEGLEEHDDHIRGPGHFRRALAFLDLLRERGAPAYAMLTLTRANLEQVVPLARLLQGRVDRFTYNRLALMGEGAALACADPARYAGFLHEFLQAAEEMEHVGIKDNLLNAALHQQGRPLAGGCTGHGCGAAFNFMALLSDGRAHACRKLDSPVGNVHEQGLAAVYDGHAAAAWRRGSSACLGCAIRPACGGCLAVAAGFGRDPLRERDPYCPAGPV